MKQTPNVKSHTQTIVLCTGKKCAKKKHIKNIDRQLKGYISRFNRQHKPRRIMRIKTSCLGICKGGPLLVVYPEGTWYHHVDEAVLAQIFSEHLENNQPVTDHIFFSMNQPTLPDED